MKHLDWGPDIKGDKKDKLRTRTKRDCYNCRKYGYFIANCPYEHRDDDDDKKKKKEMGYKRDKNYKKKPYGEAYFDKEWDLDEERSDSDSDGVATMAIKGSSSSSSKSLFLNLNIEKHMMRTRVPDLLKGSDNQRLGGDLTQIDPASEQHDPKPHNRSTTSPKVINRANMIDLAEKANPRLQIEEHKQEQKRMQHNLHR
jgi:hypothetical protein